MAFQNWVKGHWQKVGGAWDFTACTPKGEGSEFANCGKMLQFLSEKAPISLWDTNPRTYDFTRFVMQRTMY
jgi:hypothetical protein